jgi:hypothetical protein
MDGQNTSHSISSDQLYRRLGPTLGPVVVDVRQADDFNSDDRLIAGAIRRNSEQIRQPAWVMVR